MIQELYMCKVAYELDLPAGGKVRMFKSVDALQKAQKCVKYCGAVKVRLEVVEEVSEQIDIPD